MRRRREKQWKETAAERLSEKLSQKGRRKRGGVAKGEEGEEEGGRGGGRASEEFFPKPTGPFLPSSGMRGRLYVLVQMQSKKQPAAAIFPPKLGNSFSYLLCNSQNSALSQLPPCR